MRCSTTAQCGFSQNEELGVAIEILGARLEKVPQIVVEILEDRYGAARLLPGLANEPDTFGGVRLRVACEIVGVEKEEDSAAV